MTQTKRKTERCAYCESTSVTTRDHVIPKCLFERPLPLCMITVPACSVCNMVKARNDIFLRDTLLSDIRSDKHPVAKSIAEGAMLRAFERNQSEVARAILKERPEIVLMQI